MSFRTPLLALALAPLLLSSGCGGHRHTSHRQVAITVIAHDKDDFAWEGVEVYILEAWTEHSACICKGIEPWTSGITDPNGEVVFDPHSLALGELGFEESPHGVAVLSSDSHGDEATVKLLVGHDTLGWVRVDVPLTFREPRVEVFVELNS